MIMKKPTALIAGLILMAGTLLPAHADIIYIDFDSFAPGYYDGDFLAAHGISNITIGGSGPGAAGPRILNPSPHVPSSPPNVFVQHATSNDRNLSHTLSFHFSTELTDFGLSRMGTAISANSIPQWSASFYNSSGALLGSFGESYTVAMLPPRPFTFSAPGTETIARMDLTSIWTVSTFRNILVDDFVLSQAEIPEPGPVLLSLFWIGAIAVRRRRR
jgi:hypothetical protein